MPRAGIKKPPHVLLKSVDILKWCFQNADWNRVSFGYLRLVYLFRTHVSPFDFHGQRPVQCVADFRLHCDFVHCTICIWSWKWESFMPRNLFWHVLWGQAWFQNTEHSFRNMLSVKPCLTNSEITYIIPCSWTMRHSPQLVQQQHTCALS